MSTPEPQNATSNEQADHGALIDSDGREIPITENMIQQACSELDKQVVTPQRDQEH